MAELVEIIEPVERQFIVRLTETEANALLFLADMVLDNQSSINYKAFHQDSKTYVIFKNNIREIMENISMSLIKTGGYGHIQDYME